MATVAELQERARELAIEGRSGMAKAELEEAIERASATTSVRPDSEAPPAGLTLPVRLTSGGAEVLLVQVLLKLAGYQAATDGQYLRQTDRAVRRFQGDEGLEVTGEVDRDTLTRLLEVAID